MKISSYSEAADTLHSVGIASWRYPVFSADFHVDIDVFLSSRRLHFRNIAFGRFSKTLLFDFASVFSGDFTENSSVFKSKTFPRRHFFSEIQEFSRKFQSSHDLFRFQRRCPLILKALSNCKKCQDDAVFPRFWENFTELFRFQRRPHTLQCVPILR